ncbi:MAG TPA: hypothetical protein PKD53_06155 [Chloroflexaceae bacterium]|nr:hypothetical protein [Chloroflexaceae bacterium]
MHDIDRTQAEYWGEMELDGEFEGEHDGEAEWGYEGEYDGEAEWEYDGEAEGVFDEADEMELAAELLEVSDEEELDQFLGKLVRKAGKAIGKAVRSPVGRAVGGMLKGVVKKALPIAGGALGNLVVPGIGGVVGSKLASTAGSMFGLELEGMSAEDQEFEVARRLVRLGGESVRQAADQPAGPPAKVAQAAVAAAAQQHAPGLVSQGRKAQNGARGPMSRGRSNSGRWVRRGNKIVILGA